MTSALIFLFFFFSSRRRHTSSTRDWSSDVCSSDLPDPAPSRLCAPGSSSGSGGYSSGCGGRTSYGSEVDRWVTVASPPPRRERGPTARGPGAGARDGPGGPRVLVDPPRVVADPAGPHRGAAAAVHP